MIETNSLPSIASVSDLLQVISSEVRLEILLAIGSGEACVCHLETALGYRQAHISQHLMALREAGLLGTRREGKYIFYRLERPEIMEMVELAARLAGFDAASVAARIKPVQSNCDCPQCSTKKDDHV
jgi:DNA-binding transcriptional ArsR family regulator